MTYIPIPPATAPPSKSLAIGPYTFETNQAENFITDPHKLHDVVTLINQVIDEPKPQDDARTRDQFHGDKIAYLTQVDRFLYIQDDGGTGLFQDLGRQLGDAIDQLKAGDNPLKQEGAALNDWHLFPHRHLHY